MSDINLGIGAHDDGALSLLQQVLNALRALNSGQTQATKGNRQARDEKGRFIKVQQASNKELEREARLVLAASKAFIAAERQRLKASQQATQQASAASKAAVAAANAQAAAARQATASIRAQTAQAVTAARIQAAAALQQARATTAAANNAARAQLQQARAAQQAQNAAARAALQAQRAAQQAARQTNDHSAAWASLRRQIIAVAAAIGATRIFANFIKEGIQFNEVMQTATLGIASLITATSKLEDSNGRILDGAEALDAAYAFATDQVKKLRIAGLQTAATTEELVDAFQQAVGAGLAAGLNLDQIRKTTVQIVQAAGAIGVPMNQLNQEVRSILDATIDRNSRVARVLGITNEQVRLAKEQNRLADFLNDKLRTFATAGERAASTFKVVKSNLAEAVQVFAGDITKPLFDQLAKKGNDLLSRVFDFKQGRIQERFRPLIEGFQQIFSRVGNVIGGIVDALATGLEKASNYFAQNREAILATVDGAFALLGAIKDWVVNVAKLVAYVIDVGIRSGALVGIFKTLAGVIRFIAEHLKQVVIILGTISAVQVIAALVALGPIFGTIAAGVGVVLALAAAWQSAKSRAEQAAAAQERAAKATSNAAAQSIKLVAEFNKLRGEQGGLSGQELDESLKRQREIITELIALNPQYGETLRNAASDANQLAKEVNGVAEANRVFLRSEFDVFKAEKDKVDAQLVYEQGILRSIQLGKYDDREKKRLLEQQEARIQSLTDRAAQLQKNINRVTDAAIAGADAEDAAKGKVTIHGVVTNPDRKLRAERNDATQAADAELKRIKSELALTEEQLQEDFDASRLTIAQYFAALNQAQLEAATKQIAVEQRLLAGEKDAGNRAKIKANIDDIRNDQERATAKNNQDERQAYEQLTRDKLELNRAFLDATGRSGEAAAEKLREQYFKLIQRLKREGDEAGLVIAYSLFNSAAIKAEAEKAGEQMKTLADKTQAAIQELEARQSLGVISSADARRQVLALLEQERESVRKLIPVWEGLAMATADPEAEKFLQDLIDKLAKLGIAVGQARDRVNETKLAIGDAVESGLTNFLSDGIEKAHGLADAFRAMALEIVNSIQRIIARLIALKILEKLHIAVTGGFASGGYVTGPGTATSDSIPARLSAGEYVIKAAAVKSVGVEALDAINYGRTSPRVRSRGRYASGGEVLPSQAAATGGFEARVGLEPGLVLSHVASREGTKTVLQMIGSNRKAVRAALGIP